MAVMLMGVRWFVASPLRSRPVEALREERGGLVDHATIQRWVVQYSPPLEEALHRRKRAVWLSWRMDEPASKGKGQGRYRYRAVEKHGQTLDLLLTEERATKRFLPTAIRRPGRPEKLTMDGSAAHEAAIKSYKAEHGTAIAIRPITYLNNIVEQDQHGVKRGTRPMGGQSVWRRPEDAGRYCTQAHDQEKTARGGGRRRELHCGRTVLLLPLRGYPIRLFDGIMRTTRLAVFTCFCAATNYEKLSGKH